MEMIVSRAFAIVSTFRSDADKEKYNFLFRLFNILIIHKHAVTCGHKLIIIDVRLDRLFWPLFICFVFRGASCEPCVGDWVWVMASAQTVTVKKTRTSINNIRRNSFFLLNHWRFVVFMCLVGILKFNSRTYLNPGSWALRLK